MAGLQRQMELPGDQAIRSFCSAWKEKLLENKQVNAFCTALKERLLDRGSNFGKEYLKLLVNELRVDKKEVRLTGSYAPWQAHFVCQQSQGNYLECPALSLYGSPRGTLGKTFSPIISVSC